MTVPSLFRAPPGRAAGDPDQPFQSFWMGGYEGADHVNGFGQALDMAHSNGHMAQLEADHARAAALGIRTVRETIGWRICETGRGRFDLGRARRIAASAARHGLQVLWTLMHYGTPADVSLLDDSAIDRFVEFAVAVADALGPLTDEPPVYNLVNEISFLAWAVSQTNMILPYRSDPQHGVEGTAASGYEVKRRLVRMALAGIDGVLAVDERARFLHVEPLVHVVAPHDKPELAPLAEKISGYQWQAWDMLSGREQPEIGGHARALDLIGINHYHSSQWEAATENRLWWHTRDARRRPFGSMLRTAWERYRRPMIVAETSHFGEGRAQWLNELAAEVEQARAANLPVHGICLYPLIDRPDWSNASKWHNSGLWDVDPAATASPAQRRVLCGDYAAALARWQTQLPVPSPARDGKPVMVVFSHLRWGFVHHRPQQLMSRLAEDFQVLFVEEPLPLAREGEPPRLDCISHGPDIEVLLLRSPLADPTFSDPQLALLGPLLEAFLVARGIARGESECVAWFYTPMALPLLASLPSRFVVYDCIDEMSAFVNSPLELPERERALLAVADLVLTSGPALQQARQRGRDRVHCVPNGVDAAHFSLSTLDQGSAQASEARLRTGPDARPRLGYCGVIDERIDLELVAALARAHPDWDIVMAGPVVDKIDASRLPMLPNIRWLGFQPYVRLPYLIAAWDVCLIPFARNRITRFVNPTKTLEYLAAGKPVVATPLPDVIELYVGAVQTASGVESFIAACEQALSETPEARDMRIARAKGIVRRASWDARVEVILGLLGHAARRQLDRLRA